AASTLLNHRKLPPQRQSEQRPPVNRTSAISLRLDATLPPTRTGKFLGSPVPHQSIPPVSITQGSNTSHAPESHPLLARESASSAEIHGHHDCSQFSPESLRATRSTRHQMHSATTTQQQTFL